MANSDAATIAVTTVRGFLATDTTIRSVTFACFSTAVESAFRDALSAA